MIADKGGRKPSTACAGGQPMTLDEAHRALARTRPCPAASDSEWAAFHAEAESMYRQVATIDTDHHHEALHFAAMAREDRDAFKSGSDRVVDHGGETIL